MKTEILLLCLAVTWSGCACADNSTSNSTTSDYDNNAAVNRFREYIRIDTSQPQDGSDVDYSKALEFWQTQAASIGLNATVFEYKAGKPVIVITWEGTDTSLTSIMLNSHMDVVYADATEWIYPPFDAYMDNNGVIYGRGTQDMKSVGIQYLEAIRNLKADNVTLARTIHMTLVPDEEIGGLYGMDAFVKSEDFANLNVGFEMDEGLAWYNSSYIVFYADKTPWQITITCTGPGGHGSNMPTDTAGDKFRKIIDTFLDFRNEELALIAENPNRDTGTITSINLNRVSGGIANNAIPTSLNATFDIRLAVGTNITEFNETIASWINNASTDGSCYHTYILYDDISPATTLDDSNVFWTAFQEAAEEMSSRASKPCPPKPNNKHHPTKPPTHLHPCHAPTQYQPAVGMDSVLTIISPGTTDARFVRTEGVPAIGFSPMPNTYPLLHEKNEYLDAQTFLSGIDIYYNLLKKIGNA